jgi:hypothetical protein
MNKVSMDNEKKEKDTVPVPIVSEISHSLMMGTMMDKSIKSTPI